MERDALETTLILVRHGETQWNAEDRVQGQQDCPLNDRGCEQARRVSERLAGLRVDAVYSSDSGRARQTAEVVAAPHKLPVTLRPALRERSYGELEGKTLEEAAGDWVDAWRADPQRRRPPGGETQPEMARRVMAELRRITAAHAGGTVIIVTHGGPIKSAVYEVLGAPVTRWRRAFVSNGSITTLRGAPGMLRLVTFNDTCHLNAAAGAAADEGES
jgi:broad specificity phosphatase PhoE